MSLLKKLKLTSWAEFYTLKPIYKWIFYAFGWFLIFASVMFIIIELFLYIGRDKTVKKNKNKIQLTYQKFPYWMGWLFGSMLILSLIFYIAGALVVLIS